MLCLLQSFTIILTMSNWSLISWYFLFQELCFTDKLPLSLRKVYISSAIRPVRNFHINRKYEIERYLRTVVILKTSFNEMHALTLVIHCKILSDLYAVPLSRIRSSCFPNYSSTYGCVAHFIKESEILIVVRMNIFILTTIQTLWANKHYYSGYFPYSNLKTIFLNIFFHSLQVMIITLLLNKNSFNQYQTQYFISTTLSCYYTTLYRHLILSICFICCPRPFPLPLHDLSWILFNF